MKRTLGFTLALVSGLLGAAFLFSACGGDDDHGHDEGDTHVMTSDAPAGSIQVKLMNWAVQPAQSSTNAGTVTFHVVHDMQHTHTTNEGGNIHDMQVARKNADGTFKVVGQVQGLKMGESKDLTLDLTPGEYELQCNATEELNGTVIPHYVKGMHTPFTVS